MHRSVTEMCTGMRISFTTKWCIVAYGTIAFVRQGKTYYSALNVSNIERCLALNVHEI